MARRELGRASHEVATAVAAWLPPGPVVLGCSGGPDSLALAMGAHWAAPRRGADLLCVVVDHGLQPGSADVAAKVVALLASRGLAAEVRRVDVDGVGGMEAAAREARLAALAADGVPVLLGHTLDDQAETVLLGLLRGSGTRSLAGMAPTREQFIRPLLSVRRATTLAACDEWGMEVWQDPHNVDHRFRRVAVRSHLASLNDAMGRDVAPALARTASLARMDADLLDELAAGTQAVTADGALEVAGISGLPPALRLRALRDWMRAEGGVAMHMTHVMAVDRLVTSWRGQGPVDVPAGSVERKDGVLRLRPRRA